MKQTLTLPRTYLRAVPKPAPIGGLMDPRFVYVPANKTDIRETFKRIRAELENKR